MCRAWVSILALCLIAACEQGGSNSPSDPLSHWEAAASLSVPRQDLAVAALDPIGGAFAYALGGRDATGAVLSLVERYDMGNDAWEVVEPLPVPMFSANAAASEGKIWVLGFLDADGNADGRVFYYTPEADLWSEGTPMPSGTERGASAAGENNSQIFVGGGLRSGAPTADFSMFLVGTGMSGSWVVLPDLPEPRSEPAGGATEVFLVAGGRGPTGEITRDTFLYDSSISEWSVGRRMPTARAGAASLGLTVIGGESHEGVTDAVESYDTRDDVWRIRAPMLTPRRGMRAAKIEDYPAVVPGGSVDVGLAPVDTVEELFFHLPPGAVE